jgi:hypothetical protein
VTGPPPDGAAELTGRIVPAPTSPPCPRCGKAQHTIPFDDPLPPEPAVDLDGHVFVELGLAEQAIRDIRAQYDPTARLTAALLRDARRGAA